MRKRLPLFVLFGLLLPAIVAAQSITPRQEEPGQTSQQSLPPQTLTQSASANIIQFNSVSCNAGGLHTDNSYMRRFDLDGAHGLVGSFAVSGVDFGVEVANGASGSQPLTVRLYTIPNAAVLNFANLTLIGSAAVNIPNQSLSIYNVPVVGTVPDALTQDLVVEVFTPNGQVPGNSFFIGSNNLGQTAPSYLAAADCGVPQPTNTAALGFPGMHIVMSVTGSEEPTDAVAGSWGRVKSIYR